MYAQQAQHLHSQGVLFMNKIKDFFYNKNDIIIVLIILIAAGLIIYTRISAIMDYPETLAQQNAKAQQTTQASESKETTAAASSESSAAETVEITISDSDDSVAVATKLYQAGLVSSDTEFQSYISNMDKESSLKSGTFQIPKGSTDEQILNIIAN